MIENNSHFQCPPNYYTLWRYMNLSAFITLLSERSIYFARLCEFEDKWEGSLPPEYMWKLYDLPSAAATAQRQIFLETMERAVISCWHLNRLESVAMWNLYTKGTDGVAIATTVGRLKDALSDNERHFTLARVQYFERDRGDSKGLSRDPLGPILQKRRSYEHENEVRIISLDQERLDSNESSERTPQGIFVPIDLAHTLVKIVVAEHFPRWALPALQKLADQESVNVEIETSDLLRPPEKW